MLKGEINMFLPLSWTFSLLNISNANLELASTKSALTFDLSVELAAIFVVAFVVAFAVAFVVEVAVEVAIVSGVVFAHPDSMAHITAIIIRLQRKALINFFIAHIPLILLISYFLYFDLYDV